MMTLGGLAAVLTRAAVADFALKDAMEAVGVLVETESKRVIGTYELGWPQLAQATQADRVSQGFSANEPLLRTGEMRDSIGHIAEPRSVSIGSNDDKAVWQELGTATIPARSFLMGAALHKKDEILHIVGDAAVQRLITS